MAIRGLTTTYDQAGFPVVEWTETRTNGSVRMKCFITRDPATNALLFATNGSPSTGALYTQRPWEKLVGLRPMGAKDLYYTAEDHRMTEAVKSIASRKFKSAAFFITHDESIVMLAEVADDHPSIPMHLNYALGTPAEMAELHSELYRCFIDQRHALVESLCDGEYTWPAGQQQLAPNSRENSAMSSDTVFKTVCAVACGILMIYVMEPGAFGRAPTRPVTLDRIAMAFLVGSIYGLVGSAALLKFLDLIQKHGRQLGAGIMLFCIIGGVLISLSAPSLNIGAVILCAIFGAIAGVIINAVLDFLAGLLSTLLGR